MTEKSERTCGNCACSFEMKDPQIINKTQLVCRRNGPMMVQQQVRTAAGVGTQVGLMYTPTEQALVCFDGWRAKDTLPGQNTAIKEVIPGLLNIIQSIAAGNSKAAAKLAEGMLEDLLDGEAEKH